ncbi:MAG: YpdA family putative bacillithiol disulfide reductase [Gemmatimonadota bacterium]
MSRNDPTELLVVGAGPCGLAVGVAAGEAGLSCVLVDRGPIVHTLERFPIEMTWFSTPELLEIGGLPFVTRDEKPTRGEALKYYRRAAVHFELDVRQYEEVESVRRRPGDGIFEVTARRLSGDARRYEARRVVVATGRFDSPNLLGVAGEDLPKVTHYFRDPHRVYDQDVLVVGGSNSAVEAALACWRTGARVTLAHRGAVLSSSVKAWILPDIENRIEAGEIDVMWEHEVARIEPERVLLRSRRDDETTWLPNDFVLAMTGYHPDLRLLHELGVPVDPETGAPVFDPETMETPVPGLYIAGVIAAGRDGNRIFIENGRKHGARIVEHATETKRTVVDGVQPPR